MKPTHTPGPWSADPEGEVAISIEGADGSVVCDVHGAANDPRATANARLIAAAPDLLAALEACALHLRNTPDSKLVRGHADILSGAYAAIAKAKGEA